MRWAALVLVLPCTVLGPAPAAAQGGQVAGTVVDATGAVLPGATVTLAGDPAGPRSTVSDIEGRFTFSGVFPGVYTLTVFLSGFGQATVDGVEVESEPVELAAITLRLAAFDEAVVVTATRMEEPLQQVPMSISAVTGADIERRAVDDLTELARWTPGLTVVDQGARGSNVVIVRGLNTDSLNGSERPATTTTTGSPRTWATSRWRRSAVARERVEVLLGPQGTLYTLAGAVRYLPRRPDTERRTLEVRGTCSRWRTAAPRVRTPA